jgi:hypothetical protein
MFIRPGLLRLIPMVFVGASWAANIVLAHVRGRKLLEKSKKEKEKRK